MRRQIKTSDQANKGFKMRHSAGGGEHRRLGGRIACESRLLSGRNFTSRKLCSLNDAMKVIVSLLRVATVVLFLLDAVLEPALEEPIPRRDSDLIAVLLVEAPQTSEQRHGLLQISNPIIQCSIM
ncbi:hypothetical protein Mapa_016280 [Marchantia paleacea]|nr:hypothetical protein Mapa_016280 [Marchantia paleacea]